MTNHRMSASLCDFLEITKPRIMALSVFTALTGYMAAPVPIGILHLILSVFFIAVGAAGAGAFNMAFEHRTDALMQRTRNRPTATGKIRPGTATMFALLLSATGVIGLYIVAGALAAALLALTIFYYAVFYTIILKKRTPLNIVIGGVSGALPPVIGWACATGSISWEAWFLFLIIFLWTPPHSWALALYIRSDYARAGIPMLPVVKGADATRRQIWLYSIALVLISYATVILGLGGLLYKTFAIVGSALFLFYAWRVYRSHAGNGDADHSQNAPARTLFFYSIFWLFALFGFVLVESIFRQF